MAEMQSAPARKERTPDLPAMTGTRIDLGLPDWAWEALFGTDRENWPTLEPRESDDITYIPADGHPARTEMWANPPKAGVKFEANVPVKIKRATTCMVPLRHRRQLDDGRTVSESIETRVPVVLLIINNPQFSVNGETPKKQKAGAARLPENSDQYRGYALKWITGAASLDELTARWAAETVLRADCGMSDKDIEWLQPFYEGRKIALGAN